MDSDNEWTSVEEAVIGDVFEDIETQTEDSGRCDSCQVAMTSIKNIASLVEVAENVHCVMNARKEIQLNIYQFTQLGCMKKLTTAIERDVQELVKNMSNLKRQYIGVQNDLLQEKTVSESNLQKMEAMRNEINALHEEIRKEKNEHENTIQIKNSVSHQNLKNQKIIATLEVNVRNFENLVDDYRRKIKLTNEEKESMQNRVDELMKHQEGLATERDLWRKRFEDVFVKQDSVKIKAEHLQIKMHNIQGEMDKMQKSFRGLDNKFNVHNKKLEVDTYYYQELIDKVKEVVNKKCAPVTNKATSTDCEQVVVPVASVEVKGDPVVDINRQVEENNKKIRSLQEENQSLLKILNKYACRR